MRELGITYTAAERRTIAAERREPNVYLDPHEVLITTSALQTNRSRVRHFAGPNYPVKTPIHDGVLAKLNRLTQTNQEH